MAGLERSTITERTRVVASRNQLSTQLSGEAVILGLRDSVYYGLDGAGARIWLLVQEPAEIGQIASTIAGEFAVERGVALRDLLNLADELVSRGLLDIVPPTTP